MYEKSRFEETFILGQISHCFLRLYIDWAISERFQRRKQAFILLTQCDTDLLTLDDVDSTSEEDDNVNQL